MWVMGFARWAPRRTRQRQRQQGRPVFSCHSPPCILVCWPDRRHENVMKIYRFVNRVPGGLMVVPLFLGMALNTFAPNLLKIGGYTQALTGAGYPTILGMYLFTVGTRMTVRAAPKML